VEGNLRKKNLLLRRNERPRIRATPVSVERYHDVLVAPIRLVTSEHLVEI
jgi:hypothetical protein